MKKYITVAAITAVILVSAAIILACVLGSPTEVQCTTAATEGTTSGVAGTPDNLCNQTGSGHVYEGGVCVICGAEEPTGEDYLKFKLLDDGTYCVYARYIAKAPERLIIPSYYEGKPVTAIRKNAFAGYSDIKYLYIPSGVKEIGETAFKNCKNIEEIYFPETLEMIDKYAFEGCVSLKEITVNGACVTLGESVFQECENLKKAVFNCDVKGAGIGVYGTFKGCRSLETAEFLGSFAGEEDKAGFMYVFRGCESLASVTLPSETEFIGEGAFDDCASLKQLDFPESVSTIISYAFDGCTDLLLTPLENETYSITAHRIVDKSTKTLVWQSDDAPIPEDGSILNIGNGAFASNGKITEYKIPAVIETVGSAAFRNCKNLKSVVWESDCEEISHSTFQECAKLESFIAAGKTTKISSSAFYQCTSLKIVKLPDTLKEIENSAFYECSDLESIDLPDTVTEIGSSAFYECDSLEEFTVPHGVRYIDGFILYGCDSLKRVYIHSAIRSILREAFANCPNLWDIYYDGTVEEWHGIQKIDIIGVTAVHCTDGDTRLDMME